MHLFRWQPRGSEYISREVAFAFMIASSLPGRTITPARVLGGLYVTAPRLADYWKRPAEFVGLVRRAAGMEMPRHRYWSMLVEPRATTAELAASHRKTLSRAWEIMRTRSRRRQLMAEDYLCAAAEERGSGVADELLASGLQIEDLLAAIRSMPPRGFGEV